ncbi:tape-measure protein [Streptomyces sp. NPDC048717]|uniref:tape-measure protein n=1 Tax=Streptomyces sp. NPDC048717 TaxID=3154928 RepID=UPI00343338FE
MAIPRDPLAGSASAFAGLRRTAQQGEQTVRRLLSSVRRAASGIDALGRAAKGATPSVRTFGQDASAASGAVGKLGQSNATVSGLKRIGTMAARARKSSGKIGTGIGGILALLLPLLPITDIVTGLMDTFGTVMTVASVAMMAINVVMRGNPLGFVAGILLPVAGWLIEYAMNSETGQRIIKQVFQQALKGFQSVWKFLQPVFKVIGTVVGTYFKAYLTVIVTVLKVVVAAVDGLTHVRSTVTSALDALRGIASRTIGGIKSAIHPFLSFFTESVPGFFRHAKDALGKALHGMGELVKGGLSAVLGVVKGPISGLAAFANWIIDGLNKLSFDFLGKHFGVDIPKLPMLAEGGVVFPGAADAPRIDPLTVLENRRVPAVTEAPRPPHRIRDFHEDPGAGPRSTAEDLLFLAGAHC